MMDFSHEMSKYSRDRLIDRIFTIFNQFIENFGPIHALSHGIWFVVPKLNKSAKFLEILDPSRFYFP